MMCQLCLRDRELVGSHVIPEFLYRPGYDDKHRMQELRRTSARFSYIQKGHREKLLCEDCDGRLGSELESYFANLWYSPRLIPAKTAESAITIRDIDYARFKLFHLSILWRAAISTLEPFQQVTLGPLQERIRNMIWSRDPGSEEEIQVFGSVVLFPGTKEVLDGMLASPTEGRYKGRRTNTFLFGGCVWIYVQGSWPLPRLKQLSLKSEGSIILPVRDFTQFKHLHGFFIDHLAVGDNSPGA